MKLRNASRLLSVSVLGLGGLAQTSSVYAAGFALRNHSASGVGTALASDTVNTFDASGLLSNPAIMSAFKGNNLSLNVNYTDANIKASDSTLNVKQSLGGGLHPVQGPGDESNVSDPITIPSLYGIFQVSEDAHVGFSFNVPFGTNTKYADNWTGRYHGTKTELVAYDVGLHGSYKVSPMLALGVSLDWQQAKGELASAVDLGTIGVLGAAQAGQIPAAAVPGALAARAGRQDAISTYKGDSTAFAWGLGLLFRPTETTKVGLSYRGAVKHDAKGDQKWEATNADAATTLAGLRASPRAATFNESDDAKLEINLPSVTSLGYAQDIDLFTVYANITHTAWNTLDNLTPQWNGQESITKVSWKNSLYYAIGADYRLDPEWTLRAGVGRDQSVTDKDHRTPRTPDGDRTALALGGSYKVGALDLSLSVEQLFLKNTKSELDADEYLDNNYRGTLRSTYKINPTIAALSAGYNF